MSADSGHTSFFRQSTWMMTASVAGGAFMFAVHFFSKKIPAAEYGVLGTLLAMVNCMSIPALCLQMVFAQQAAAALSEEQNRQLTGTAHGVLLGTFFVWLFMAGGVVGFSRDILTTLKIANPTALWATVFFGLLSLWQPIFNGLMQGKQNFLWLGWVFILAGLVRFLAVAVIVLLLNGWAAGMMIGAVLAQLVAFLIVLVQSWKILCAKRAPFDWRDWLARVVPLTFGFGACQFMFASDALFVQTFFDRNETGPYMAAGTLCRALVLFTAPLAAVMFPKVVRGVALAERTSVLSLTLISTAVLVTAGALGLWLVGPWVLRLVFTKEFLVAVPLLPWFAVGMGILALANVLVNNLMARARFEVVPWLVMVAAGYATALTRFHGSFLEVIQTLGVFSLLFLAIAAWFTWGRGEKAKG